MKMISYLGHGVPVKYKLEAYSIPEPNSGCWLWLAYTNSNGYGTVVENGKSRAAHRASYEEYKGPIPEGMLVCHRCDTPSCINPDHLFLGTYSDNSRDCVSKNRHSSRKGTDNGRASVTEEQVLRIIKDLEESYVTLKDLAQKHNVSPATVGRINAGHNWTHLTKASPGKTVRSRRDK